MSDVKDGRNEVHISKKVTTMSETTEFGVSLLSSTDSVDDLLTKAKGVLNEPVKKN